VHSRAV
jgi:hypothetical protein